MDLTSSLTEGSVEGVGNSALSARRREVVEGSVLGTAF
jgi:hypothetical protein